jgi:hypothetical protein
MQPPRPDEHKATAGVTTAMRRRALVVFEDRAEGSMLHLLRPGFRHCFCLVGSAEAWVVCDPLKSRLEIWPIYGFGEQQLAARFLNLGCTVLLGAVATDLSSRRWLLRALTCVEVVKRALNIEAARVFTPYQLHQALLSLPAPFEAFRTFDVTSHRSENG